MTNLIVNGVSYPYPQEGDPAPWGAKLNNWATAVTSGMLQKSGGTFTLTADVDFGASFGLKSAYFKSRTANPASSGLLRLAKTDTVGFRNQANSANLLLGIDANNLLKYQGFPFRSSVTDFGAVGDGSHDDTPLIQACIDATNQTLGVNCLAEVYLPATRDGYKITNKLTIPRSIRLVGDNSGQSFLVFSGSNAVPMIELTVDADFSVVQDLGFDNTGSATMAIQCNASNVVISRVRSRPTVKFSTAFVSTQQSGTYSNNVSVIDSSFICTAAGNETPIGIWFVDGFGLRAYRCYVSGATTGILAASGDHGGIDGVSIVDFKYETFDGATGPGTTGDVGIDVEGVYGINIVGFSSDTTLATQRAIKLGNFVKGGGILNSCLTGQGGSGSAAIKISGGSNVQNVNIDGNVFHDFALAGVEVTATGSTYYASPQNGLTGGTPLIVSDTYSPPATAGRFRLPYDGTIQWRNFGNTANLSLTTDGSDRLSFNQGFFFRNDQNTSTTGILKNANAEASAVAKFTLSTSAGDFDFTAAGGGAGATADIIANSGYTGGLRLNSVGGTLKLRTASTDRLTITTAGQVAISGLNYPTSDGTSNQFLKTNGSGTLSFGSVSTSIAVVAKTANYTLTTSNDLVTGDVSGGAFTLTLPTAVGNTGKIFTIKRTDQTLGTALTVNTTSSQTIDGALTFKLMTQYESLQVVSDGANWQIIEHSIPSDATTFTMVVTGTTSNPTFNASPTLNVATWKRVGDSIQIRYQYQQTSASGTAVGSGNYLFALPSGLTIDTAKLPVAVANNNCVGSAFVSNAADLTSASSIIANVVAYDSSHLAIRILSSTTTAALVSSSAAAANNGNLTYAFEATVPVTNWKG